MKKEKTVRTYQRRTKSGKMVTVREHKASYDAAEEARKAAAKKAGAGSELSKKKAAVEENPLGFSADDYKEWYHWDMENDANNEAALRVEKALTKKMGKKAYNKYLEDMSNSYTARGHKKAHQSLLDEYTAQQKKQDAESSKTAKDIARGAKEKAAEAKASKAKNPGKTSSKGTSEDSDFHDALKASLDEAKENMKSSNKYKAGDAKMRAGIIRQLQKDLKNGTIDIKDAIKSLGYDPREPKKTLREQLLEQLGSSRTSRKSSAKSETSTPESSTIPKSESALKKAGWTYVRTNRGKVGGGSIGYWVSPDRETMISGKSSYRPGSGKSVSIEADKPKKVTKSVLALLDKDSRASTTSAKKETSSKTKKTMNEVIEESGGKRITSGGAVRLNGELIPHAHYKAYKRTKSEKKRQEILALLPPKKRKILEEHFKKNEDIPKTKKSKK